MTKVSDLEFRCPTDRATRRLHYDDIKNFISKDTARAVCWLKHLDPIAITNIACWVEINGYGLFQILLEGGLFNDIKSLMEVGSDLSSYVKRFTYDEDNLKQALSEINVLTGFLNVDVIPVDWVTKMMELAHGGEPHGVDQAAWLNIFKSSLDEVSRGYGPDRVKFMPLDEYISSGKWITGGSCTIGKVHWEFEGKGGKFRARKNMVQLLFDKDELYHIVMNWNGITESEAFIKNEIAKRRLAVASNFEAYITDSYMLYLYGHSWKNWKYVTLDETPRESQLRTAHISHLLANKSYALPFDYDSFDHQAQTPELMIIVRKFVDAIDVPPSYRETWTKIKRLILSGYERGVMRIRKPDGEIVETKVTGGLPSGVRLTSLIGNVWNATVTNLVVGLATTLTGGKEPQAVGVRGDDTYVLSDSPTYLGLVRRLYQAVNARGKDTKFGIATGVCEFLRNEISPTGQRGWANRTITSVTQRKPWTSAPWEVDQQVTITRCAIDTLSRRVGRELTFLHRANKTKWSRFYRQSTNWLHLPRRMGGIGLYEDRGMRPSGKLPLAVVDRVHYSNVIPTAPPWAVMSGEEQLAYSQLEMTRRLSTDDIPKASLAKKNELIDAVRKTKITWSKVTPTPILPIEARCPQATKPAQWPAKFRAPREVLELGPNVQVSFEEALSSASSVARAKNTTVRKVLQPLFPATWNIISQWEARGWHRTDAINMALGKTPTELTFPLHPELSTFVEEAIRRRCGRWVGRRYIASRLYGYTRGAVQSIIEKGGLYVYAY